jgi:hypothetical protein
MKIKLDYNFESHRTILDIILTRFLHLFFFFIIFSAGTRRYRSRVKVPGTGSPDNLKPLGASLSKPYVLKTKTTIIHGVIK